MGRTNKRPAQAGETNGHHPVRVRRETESRDLAQGNYIVHIKIIDRVSGKNLTRMADPSPQQPGARGCGKKSGNRE